ncbi:MAG: flagellar motor switch protein FliG [Planctomycetaceae bacterium]|nr:flagellar motor switch protein FliG [Planctomycetaceae bacterium]
MAKVAKQFNDVDELTGVQKTAVLLLALGTDTAAVITSRMNQDTVEFLARELASIGTVNPRVRNAVVDEFYFTVMASAWATEGGLDYATDLLRKSVEPEVAEQIIQQISRQVQRTPFSFLQKAESDNLLTFIQDEHPQTIALILSHLSHTKSAEILGGLPTDKQVEVVRRIANMEQTNPEVIREVEEGLEARLSSMLMQRFEKAGGVETIAEVLNLVDRTTERGIMDGLETDSPDLVEEIRRLMFVFEDIGLVDERGIQAVLKEVDNDELSLSLRTASDELKQKIFRNMSERAAELIKEEMEFMGPVRLSDVEAAQQRVVDIVRRLEEAGEIIVDRGGSSELVV